MKHGLKLRIGGLGLLFCAGLALVSPGCAVTDRPGSASPTAAVAAEKGAAEIWADTCMNCHNMRSPASLNDAQWQVAVHHMRVIANLTPKEHTTILKFLKAGN